MADQTGMKETPDGVLTPDQIAVLDANITKDQAEKIFEAIGFIEKILALITLGIPSLDISGIFPDAPHGVKCFKMVHGIEWRVPCDSDEVQFRIYY